MKKILVLRGGALGDLVVTLPALALLRARWPDACIELAGNVTAAALACGCGLLDAAHSQHEARWSALYDPAPLPPELARQLSEYDLVVNFWPDPDGVLQGHLRAHTHQVFLHGESQPARTPAAAHYCERLRALGLATLDYHFPLAPSDRLGLRLDPCIAVHPGSGSPRKNWPVARWRELIATLPGPVLLILGEAEMESWSLLPPTGLGGERGVTSPPGTGLRFAVNLPLEELATELARCRLFLGHDSGVSHLAAACGVPSILLFGPSDPAMWAPPARHVRVLRRGEDLHSISVADVQQAVSAALPDRT